MHSSARLPRSASVETRPLPQYASNGNCALPRGVGGSRRSAMSRMKLLVAMASLLAVVATVQGLSIRVPFLVDVPKRPVPVEAPLEEQGPVRWTVRPTQSAAVAGREMDVLVTLEAD